MTEASAAGLAVVIVNYETGAWLERCLRSLESARGDVTVEVVVIDNASSDGSADISQELGARLIRNETNRWLSPAWNQGAAATHAVSVVPEPRYRMAPRHACRSRHGRRAASVGRIVGPMLRNPDGTVYPSGRHFRPRRARSDARVPFAVQPEQLVHAALRDERLDRSTEREVDWVSGAAMLIPSDAFDAVGGFDEGFPLYGEELDIATRLRALERTALFTPAAEVVHAVGVSTGGARRPHRLVVMHSQCLYRYYAKHRAPGRRRAPFTSP